MDILQDVKVLSFNHFLAGPAAAQFLGDMGADVIAIEPLNGAFQGTGPLLGTLLQVKASIIWRPVETNAALPSI